MSAKKVIVRQTRSTIGQKDRHLKTLKSLGLGRIGRSAVHDLSPSLTGMLKSVSHLVIVKPA